MKLYAGRRTPEGCSVTVNGRPLPLKLDLRNHSPTGFEWGYAGSGPAQLALAILADSLGDEMAAEAHQRFTRDVIAHLPRKGWHLAEMEVRRWFHKYNQQIRRGKKG